MLQDNDPRRPGRILEVTGHGVMTAMGLEHVYARPVDGGRQVAIACRRIYADTRPRSRGFSVIDEAMPLEHQDPLRALIGKPVWLLRGARGRDSGPGHFRRVRAILDGVDGELVHATLLEDDAEATVEPLKKGERGIWHGRSFVEPLPDQAEGVRND